MIAWDKIKAAWAAMVTRKNEPDRAKLSMVPAYQAGVFVDHDTALTVSGVYRAVAYISQGIAGLPWNVIRETERRTTILPTHNVAPLLRRSPNPEMSAFAWRETMVAWALTWGNGYSEIEFDGAGRPIALWPISPDRVEVKRSPIAPYELVYEVNNSFDGTSYLPRERVFHLHGLGFDGLVGYSVISLAARSLGLAMASEKYASDYFANGTVSTGVIKHPKVLSTEAHSKLRADFEEKNSKFGRKWRPLILEEGMEWQSLSIPPEDSQLLETRKFQVNDIARWFGLPPHKLMDLERATFTNIEHQSIEVVNDGLMPWVHRFEQEADTRLFSGRERGVRTKLDTRGLLRGDDKSRAEYYQAMRNLGIMTTNEIRAKEDLNPVGPEGDELVVQVNQTTLKRLVAGDIPGQAQEPTAPAQQALLPMAEATFARLMRRETGQFEQVSHKLNGDSGTFRDWADRFFVRHAGYVADEIAPVLASLNALMPEPLDDDDLGTITARMASGHVAESRRMLAAAMISGGAPWDAAERSKDSAKRMLAMAVTAMVWRGHDKN